MNPMKWPCPYCQHRFSATRSQLGTQVVCPRCRRGVQLPAAEAAGTGSEPEQQIERESLFRRFASGLTSMVLHMGLLLLLALVTCDLRDGGGTGEEIFIGHMPAKGLDNSPEKPLDARDAEARAEKDELKVEIPAVTPTAGEVQVDVKKALAGGASGGGSTDIDIVGTGGGGLGGDASFMGIKAKGSRFCIIADRSGSMLGPKIQYLKQEILEAISRMTGKERFQVVLFNHEAQPFPEAGWRHPKADFQRLKSWLESIQAAGGTDPTPAFREALKLSPRPDVIFFMTDGQFDPAAVEVVAALNRGKETVIHTISFVDQSAEPLLKKIASDSGGTYRHVAGF